MGTTRDLEPQVGGTNDNRTTERQLLYEDPTAHVHKSKAAPKRSTISSQSALHEPPRSQTHGRPNAWAAKHHQPTSPDEGGRRTHKDRILFQSRSTMRKTHNLGYDNLEPRWPSAETQTPTKSEEYQCTGTHLRTHSRTTRTPTMAASRRPKPMAIQTRPKGEGHNTRQQDKGVSDTWKFKRSRQVAQSRLRLDHAPRART